MDEDFLGYKDKLNNIAPFNCYDVYVPFREEIFWPKKCVLCGTSKTNIKKTYVSTYKSHDYVIAKNMKTIKFPGAKLCRDCSKNIKKSWLVLQIEFIVAFLIAIGLFSILFFYYRMKLWLSCTTCIVSFIVLFFSSLIITSRVIKKSSETEPVKIKIGRETRIVGISRPIWFKFSFQNKEVAYNFAEKNKAFIDEVCDKCGSLKLRNHAIKKDYCLVCDLD